MNPHPTPEHSPLQRTLKPAQTAAILVGVVLLISALYGLSTRRAAPSRAAAPVVEMSTLNRDIESDGAPVSGAAEPPPSSHEQQVKAEILNNMKHGAQIGQ